MRRAVQLLTSTFSFSFTVKATTLPSTLPTKNKTIKSTPSASSADQPAQLPRPEITRQRSDHKAIEHFRSNNKVTEPNLSTYFTYNLDYFFLSPQLVWAGCMRNKLMVSRFSRLHVRLRLDSTVHLLTLHIAHHSQVSGLPHVHRMHKRIGKS